MKLDQVRVSEAASVPVVVSDDETNRTRDRVHSVRILEVLAARIVRRRLNAVHAAEVEHVELVLVCRQPDTRREVVLSRQRRSLLEQPVVLASRDLVPVRQSNRHAGEVGARNHVAALRDMPLDALLALEHMVSEKTCEKILCVVCVVRDVRLRTLSAQLAVVA